MKNQTIIFYFKVFHTPITLVPIQVESKVILILSHRNDYTTDMVVKQLQSRKIDYFRFNTERFPLYYQCCIRSADGQLEGRIVSDERSLDLSSIRRVWYRRPMPASFDGVDLSLDDLAFAQRESNTFLSNLISVLPQGKWVNDPFACARAEIKSIQLSTAISVGFTTPPTCIGNDPAEFEQLRGKVSGKVVIKPISHGGYGPDDGQAIFCNEILDRSSLRSADVRLSPFIMQERVDKLFDVRVTGIGNIWFAHKITSRSSEILPIDWRAHDQSDLAYPSFNIPDGVKKRLQEFMKVLDLKFGAFDFSIDERHDWVFLEVNPSGQFAWLEIATGDKMIEALIDLLSA